MKLLWIMAALFGLYVLYGAAAVALHRSFIYPFAQEPFTQQGFSEVSVQVAAAEPLPVYVADAGAGAPVVVYFMGNAGALELFTPMLAHHRAAGRSVVAMTYRGGGGVPGAPSEAVLKRDALAVMDALPDLVQGGPVILHGYSLGTGLAVHVAANRAADAVILSAPYTSMCGLMARASRLPACLLPVDTWKSHRHLGMSKARPNPFNAPLMLLHGTEDDLIPAQHTLDIVRSYVLDGPVVEHLLIEGAGHTNLMDFPDYLQAIDAFIARIGAVQ